MSHGDGRSQPAAAAAPSGAASAPRSPWISGPVSDLLLFVGTPLLILPLVLGAESFTGPATIYLYVAAFGAVGHHLPGMMRAYGDRALFRRFKVRFIVAPIFLLAVCIGFALTDPTPMILVVYGWGIWHGLMQTHGFLRIYDSKWRSFGALTARLDHLTVLAWFAAGVLFSPSRMQYVLEAWYRLGGALVSAEAVHAARLAWGGFTGLVTLAFVVNAIHCWRAGRPANPLKFVLLATTIAFWLFSNVFVTHVLLGIALFEIFHDVQYLAIVWRFNRSRVDADPEVGSFSRFLFRRSGVMVGLYVGLVFAYGSMRLLQGGTPQAALTGIVGGILAASTLLHFYFDGFIWKMREKDTRKALGVEGGEDRAGPRRLVPAWAAHGLKWGLLVVPLAGLSLLRLSGPVPEAQAMVALAEVSPDHVPAQYNLGLARHEAGDLEGAAAAFRRGIELGPYDEELDHALRVNLAWSLVEQAEELLVGGRDAEAGPLLDEVLALNPGFPEILLERGLEALRASDGEEAERHSRAALAMDPELADGHLCLALALRSRGELHEAWSHVDTFRRMTPGDPRADRLASDLEDALRRGGHGG